MKLYQITTVLAFIATGVIATPAGITKKDNQIPEKSDNDYLPKKGVEPHRGENYPSKEYGGKKVEWDLERCDWCPYIPKSWPETGDVQNRKGNGYKLTCPEEKKKCQKYSIDLGKASYSGYFSKYQKCSRGDDYKVTASMGHCQPNGLEKCLNVIYEDWEKGFDKTAYLGLYTSKKQVPESKKYLNRNRYCNKNECHIPIEEIPGFPTFKETIWVGIDCAQCRDPESKWGGHGGKKGRKGDEGDDYGSEKNPKGHEKRGLDSQHGVKYVEFDIEAKHSKKCDKFCCCA
ncbi:hypothetical protein FHETE_4261 [Fusarium heterosporum]|uniref:Secreted protein n=1 Tax=Fusarium heterosporum TaxID=42747 RepID=A0A8H5TF17_FUSHE|nr:hypothetical protein FHETE_4261 [Fusarium heterosporum]